jgi:DnaJ family protein A protein 2
MSTLYDLLGVDKGADADTLKKAFRRKALTEHPDKGGDNDRFRKINEAYNVLSDSQKRAYYDQTGEIPTDGPVAGPTSGGGMPNFADIFGSMFGGGGFPMPMFHGMGGGPPQKAQRGPNKLHEIGVTLADMYAGRTIKLHMKRDCLCGECGGKGGNIMESCAACRGRGVRMLHQQMGPMITVSQQPCEACRATGQRATDKCGGCSGRRVVEREASLDVVIEPGMQEGDRIVFPGQCSESPDFETPGDVILVVRSASTDTAAWERRGADLIVKVELTLAESLLGWSRSLSGHPSGLSVPLVWRGGVVRDGEVLRVPGWGMPRRSAASAAGEKGELRLLCRVSEGQGQGAWSEEQQRALKSVWPDWVEPVEEEGSVKPERP